MKLYIHIWYPYEQVDIEDWALVLDKVKLIPNCTISENGEDIFFTFPDKTEEFLTLIDTLKDMLDEVLDSEYYLDIRSLEDWVSIDIEFI
ncbi:hypothetical protein [Virgibacillus sp. SK37]|uniref:hypothetical protein n=1 Tax=Virgibacillus sp. SK37 TaxID=403957 RepID=UPI0004D11B11|nr:hypothetical protein [Virgibacillus sp. SK37]AIF45662.1 hypothetical protein X953_18915 [Virgibacillus sp. SK37]